MKSLWDFQNATVCQKISLSSVIFPQSHKQNLFTTGVPALKML